MHIHLPKPLHGWREFAGEVGIIVIGVLIALGAEQLVESLHWRREVREFREAVDKELALNLGTFKVNEVQHGCIRRRLDELQSIVDRSRHGESIDLAGPIGMPVLYSQYSSVWDNKDAQVVAHLPTAVRLKYAEIYDEFRNTAVVKARQSDAWDGLRQFEEPGPLMLGERRQLHALISKARSADFLMEDNWPYSDRMGAALGIRAEMKDADALAARLQSLDICKPILKRG